MGRRLLSTGVFSLAMLFFFQPDAYAAAARCFFTNTTPVSFAGRINYTLTLDFGTIDPSSLADVSPGTLSANPTPFQFGCTRNTAFTITQNGGQRGNNTLLNQNGVDTLPYSLTISPSSGNATRDVLYTVTVAGTVNQLNFQDAQVGNYSDTVTLSLSP